LGFGRLIEVIGLRGGFDVAGVRRPFWAIVL